MNKVILTGRLTKDVEVKTTNTGKAVAQFTVASNRITKDASGNYEADFIPCVAWQKNAEFISKYFAKGSPILVEGRMQVRSYDKNGEKRYVTEVIVDRCEFYSTSKQDGAGAQQSQNKSCMDGFGQAVPFDEEIPF